MAVLVPVKSFAEAKTRLAPALSPAERATLARRMATTVVAAAAPLPVAVVCDDAEVAAWARDCGALVVWEPERGLNRAVEAGVARVADHGVRQCIVVHADLPLARHLAWMSDHPGVTIVADRAGNGTNAICIPTGVGFGFSYGPGSCARHVAEAGRLGLGLRLVEEDDIAHDVDVPGDIDPELLVLAALAVDRGTLERMPVTPRR